MHVRSSSCSEADLCPSCPCLALPGQGSWGWHPLSFGAEVWDPLLVWAQLRHLVARLQAALMRVQLMAVGPAQLLAGVLPPALWCEHLLLEALLCLELTLAWSCLLPQSQPLPQPNPSAMTRSLSNLAMQQRLQDAVM